MYDMSWRTCSEVLNHIMLVCSARILEWGYALPASPSMYVMADEMTAVFRKPLSLTRRPLSAAFSSRSPAWRGAVIDLNAVAATALSAILASRALFNRARSQSYTEVRTEFHRSCLYGCHAR
jgi:hypothetical protein